MCSTAHSQNEKVECHGMDESMQYHSTGLVSYYCLASKPNSNEVMKVLPCRSDSSSSSSRWPVEEVVSIRSFEPGTDLCRIIVGKVEPSRASECLTKLSECLPLSGFNLDHLKRIRRISQTIDGKKVITLEVALCPEYYADSIIPEVKSLLVDSNFQFQLVPKFAPLTNDEFQAWGSHWPLIFRPNELDKDRQLGVSTSELSIMQAHLSLVQSETELMQASGHIYPSGAVIVNPTNNMIVTTTSHALHYYINTHGERCLRHPLLTPTMICVEAVAAIIREDVLAYNDLPVTSVLNEDPYVCNGLHLYIQEEPDVMSAMSLVHSRIGKVIFVSPNLKEGALSSCVQLHSLPSLNHHFRVYRVINL